MCNLYSVKVGQKHIADTAHAVRDLTGNMPPMPAIFPNGRAPIVRAAADGIRELVMARWGFPPPNIPGSKPRNPYLTNVRNADSRYWLPCLKNPAGFHAWKRIVHAIKDLQRDQPSPGERRN